MIAVLAVGFTILYQGSQFFVFSYGASFTWAAYTPFLLAGQLPNSVAVAMGVAIAIILGGLLEQFVYQPIRRRGENALILMLASIGSYTVLQNTISLTFGDATRSIRDWVVEEGSVIFDAHVSNIQLLIVSASIVLIVAVWLFVEHTPFGCRLRAVAGDPYLARVRGIDVEKAIMSAVILGSGIVGIAGVLFSLDTDLMPTMGFQALLLGMVAAIIGGNRIKGAVVGGIFLGLAQNLGIWKLPTEWQDAIVFLILIIFFILKPRGFSGISSRKAAV